MNDAEDELRSSIARAMERGEVDVATSHLRQLARGSLSHRQAAFVASRLDELGDRLHLPELRLAFARSFTVEPLLPLLRARCLAAGWRARVHCGDFGTYAQDLLDADGELVGFAPHVVFLAVRTCDLLPALWRAENDGGPEAIEQAASDLESWLLAFRRASEADVVVHGFELPPTLDAGVHEAQRQNNRRDAVWELNRKLRAVAGRMRGVYVLDYQGLLERHGTLHWHDERKWLMARMPIDGDHLVHLADEYLRFLHPLRGHVAKVLVLDLDDTLWHGVVGEDGPDGIRLGSELPGAPFRAVQQAALDLRDRGILLAVCSKNNPDDALEVLENHPDMLIRPHHLSALRINWNDKATNLREIADELNVGVDSLAFLDDSRVEREWVRSRLPQVFVLECPEDPMARARSLLASPVLERLSVSDEDRRRPELYTAERERDASRRSAASLNDFFASLDMRIECVAADGSTLPRIAQLTQKTNQFNLTTRRYSEPQIEAATKQPHRRILAYRVTDRFGDAGLVGVVLLDRHDESFDVDTFLMSCRVIGRGVESAMLWHVAGEAEASGGRWLRAEFVPTRKNQPAADFLPRHGFVRDAERRLEAEGATAWRLDLAAARTELPEWIDFVGNRSLTVGPPR